jgi:hypothetical protein
VVFFRALWVRPLPGGRERLPLFHRVVFSKSWYHHALPTPTAASSPSRVRRSFGRAARLLHPKVQPPATADDTHDEDLDQDDDDFLQ